MERPVPALADAAGWRTLSTRRQRHGQGAGCRELGLRCGAGHLAALQAMLAPISFFPPSGLQEGVQHWRHFGYRLVAFSRIFVCGVPMRAGALSLEDQTFARRKPRKLYASLVVSKSRSMTT